MKEQMSLTKSQSACPPRFRSVTRSEPLPAWTAEAGTGRFPL